MGPLGPRPLDLTAGTVDGAKEAIHLLKRLRRERNNTTRRALLTAVEELVREIRAHEDKLAAHGYRLRPPGEE